jgi:hypothetical protein
MPVSPATKPDPKEYHPLASVRLEVCASQCTGRAACPVDRIGESPVVQCPALGHRRMATESRVMTAANCQPDSILSSAAVESRITSACSRSKPRRWHGHVENRMSTTSNPKTWWPSPWKPRPWLVSRWREPTGSPASAPGLETSSADSQKSSAQNGCHRLADRSTTSRTYSCGFQLVRLGSVRL